MSGAVVTGAAGFIGTHLVKRLASLGRRVVAVDVRPRPPALDLPGTEYLQGDIRDLPSMREAISGAATVYHLASVHLEVRTPEEEFQAVNVEAVGRLVSLAAAEGVARFVHTSSVGIYGHVSRPPAVEGSPKRPLNAYERTKLEGEREALRRASELGIACIVLRPAWAFGPGCSRTAKLLRAIGRRRFVYLGDGSNLRHPVYVDEVVDAFLLAEGAPDACAGRPYIVAGPRALTLREMVETCAGALEVPPPRIRLPIALGRALGVAGEFAFGAVGRDPPFSRRSVAFFRFDNAFDTSAAREELGFVPKVDFAAGIERTLQELGPAPAVVR